MTTTRISTHQKTVLELLKERSGHATGGYKFVEPGDGLAPAALEHLHRKGFVDKHVHVGLRGGKHNLYRPATAGAARCTTDAVEPMNSGEMDTRLIRARDAGTPVEVLTSNGTKLTGIPGEVERSKSTGNLLISIGQRKIALFAITRVGDSL